MMLLLLLMNIAREETSLLCEKGLALIVAE
jgi:hypothetical protein